MVSWLQLAWINFVTVNNCFVTREESLHGKCKTSYTIHQLPDDNLHEHDLGEVYYTRDQNQKTLFTVSEVNKCC